MSAGPGELSVGEQGPGEYDVLDTVMDGLSPTSRDTRFHPAGPGAAAADGSRLTAALPGGYDIRRAA